MLKVFACDISPDFCEIDKLLLIVTKGNGFYSFNRSVDDYIFCVLLIKYIFKNRGLIKMIM